MDRLEYPSQIFADPNHKDRLLNGAIETMRLENPQMPRMDCRTAVLARLERGHRIEHREGLGGSRYRIVDPDRE